MRARVLVGSLFLSLIAGLIPDGVALADPTPSPKPATGLVSEAEAMREAKASGLPVVVSALTDERTLVTADPATGRFSADLTAGVARVKDAKGGWREPSANLVRGEDGLWRPEAAVAEIAVSAVGAKAPLVSFADGESKVEVGWPSELPTPTVDGATGPTRRYSRVWISW